MSATDSVTVTTIVPADPAEAFRIFTEEIALWWKPKVPHLFRKDRIGAMKFEAGPGGRLLEIYASAPDDPFEVGRVLTWTPPKRLAFEWRQRDFSPNEITRVEVSFEAVPGGTRITLEHRGWDVLAADHPARHGMRGGAFTSMIGLRWADLLVIMRTASQRPK